MSSAIKSKSGGPIEESLAFEPQFGPDGLIPAIVTDAATGQVLMFAWMNAQALTLTLESRIAHFYSRSRGKLWRKGEESGNTLAVREIRTDCDQDVVWIAADVGGAGNTCHTGRPSCFYRVVAAEKDQDGAARLEIDQRLDC